MRNLHRNKCTFLSSRETLSHTPVPPLCIASGPKTHLLYANTPCTRAISYVSINSVIDRELRFCGIEWPITLSRLMYVHRFLGYGSPWLGHIRWHSSSDVFSLSDQHSAFHAEPSSFNCDVCSKLWASRRRLRLAALERPAQPLWTLSRAAIDLALRVTSRKWKSNQLTISTWSPINVQATI